MTVLCNSSEEFPLETKREGEKPFINTTFTRQVDISYVKDEEMSTNIGKDLDHGSSTAVRNCDQISRNLSSFRSSFLSSSKNNLSRKTCYYPCFHIKNDTLLTKGVEHFVQPDFGRSRLRNKAIGLTACLRNRDREPSKIPQKKKIRLMNKSKHLRGKIKIYIKQFIPMSSLLHNFLSTTNRKDFLLRQTNEYTFWTRHSSLFGLSKTFNSCIRNQKLKNLCKHRTRKQKFYSSKAVLLLSKTCNQRLATFDGLKLIVCGDIEMNPGPVDSLSLLISRLARIGLSPVNVMGDGNCFFRSVSHQPYGTERHHPQIRALAIQHLINCPEHFIEYNTNQSWAQYLHSMSQLGTWADNIIIQAVANTKHLRIHVIESAQNFSEATVVSSIYNQQGGNLRDIYIGHLDELHYVSTKATSRSACKETGNQKRIVQPQSQPRKLVSNDTLPQKGAGLQSRKDGVKMNLEITKIKEKRYITKSTNV